MKIKIYISFVCGAMAHVGYTMAHMDWLGLDGYIQYCKDHWINYSPIVGIAIALTAVGFYCAIVWGEQQDHVIMMEDK